MHLNGFDWTLVVLAGALGVLGLIKGMTRILVGIAALIAAFIAAARLHRPLAERLTSLSWSIEARGLLAWFLIFVAVMLVGALVARLIRGMLGAAKLGWMDRLAGGAMGLAAAALLSALLILPGLAYLPTGTRVLEGSTLAPYVAVLADVANTVTPVDLSRRYRERMEDLRLHWRERWAASRGEHPAARS